MILSPKEKLELFREFKKQLEEAKKLYVEVCRDNVELPQPSNLGTGMDIKAAEETTLLPGETKIIPTGLKIAIPEGYELEVRPGLDLPFDSPLRIVSTPVKANSEIPDEMGIAITNTSPEQYYNRHFNSVIDIKDDDSHWNTYGTSERGNKRGIYQIQVGDKIARVVLRRYEKIEVQEVDDIKRISFNPKDKN